MTSQQVEQVAEQNQDLVAYVQDYQGRLAEAQFLQIQERTRAEKAERKVRELTQVISELKRDDTDPDPLDEDADQPADL